MPDRIEITENESSRTARQSGAYWAHTRTDAAGCISPEEAWEPLFTPFAREIDPDDPEAACSGEHGAPCRHCEQMAERHGHLNKVAWWSGHFAAEMFPPDSEAAKAAKQWGWLVGLWHDLGKFAPEFQQLLRGDRSRANHSTAGAQHAQMALPGMGQLLAYAVAGHHAGLADLVTGGDSSLKARIEGKDYLHDLPEATSLLLSSPNTLKPSISTRGPGAWASFTRMLFSCLIDSDFLATETFMSPEQAVRRFQWPDDIIERMITALDQRYAEFDPITPDSPEIDSRRAGVHADCLAAAEREPGLFTLTVPTGGGKTLASLAFALRHARKHGLRRVIFVVPYTSIIEQNADEYRKTFAGLAEELGRDPVLEHHSNFEDSGESEDLTGEKPLWRLAAENWDAPLIVTTAVQFFESLHANRTSRCRKLHRIARSVVIFDEAQTLPPDLLTPCLDSIRHLTRHFGATVVLCTATQPALGKLPAETPGEHAKKWNRIALDLEEQGSAEIIGDVDQLFAGLSRTRIAALGPLSDDAIVEHLRKHERVLCIVNTKPHAARLFEALGSDDPANLHLSAQLSPAHRSDIVAEIKRREGDRKKGRPAESCRVIATTVVEAGVDLDFPIIYRALTGLDSLAQAAGRCNRHGTLGERGGKVFLFFPTDQKVPAFLIQSVNATTSVLPDFHGREDDLILPEAIEAWFREFYFNKGEWDAAGIRDLFRYSTDSTSFPFHFDFNTAAQKFQLIPDTQAPVIIEPKPGRWPGMDENKAAEIRMLIDAIREADRYGHFPPGGAHRTLQRHTVQVPKSIHAALVSAGKVAPLCDGRFPVLVHPENDYDSKLGLRLPDHRDLASAFLI